MARRLFSYPISLAVVVATLIATTGGFIAWWNYRTGVDNVRELAGRLFDQIAREAAGETEAFLMRAPPAAATLVGLVERAPAQDVIARRCITVLRANPAFKWVSYSDRDGQFTGAYREGGAIRLNHSWIVDGVTQLAEYEVGSGNTLAPLRTAEDTKYDPRTRPFYQLATASTSGVWTPPYVFAENVPGITYALAVRAEGGVAGVFTIDFDLAGLSELTRALRVSDNGRVVVTSGDGVVLAHPTESTVRTAVADGTTELVNVTALADPVLRAAIRAGSAVTAVVHAGETYLVRTLPLGADTGWRVTAYAPEADFTAAMRGRVLTSLLISFIAVLFAVGVAWVLARRVSGPLTTLSDEMVKVGGLHLDDAGAARPTTLFREIDMMHTSLARMKGGLRSFARYVPRDLVRTLLASGHDAELSGEVRELTVFFSDLAGFTSLSETRAPDELVRFLGEYFDDMSQIIAAERGTVDKYMGDGIMAFWGAPLDVDRHAARACTAALLCQRRVRQLSAKGVSLGTRIGLATGNVLVGNIGSTERINYTVMGDTANLASRLEGLNKQYGTDSMISEATYEQARRDVVARPIDVVAVKGKSRGVRVYELLALVSDHDAEAEAIAEASARALDAYLARDFAAAIAGWDEVLARRLSDKAARIMRQRAEQHLATPPPTDWSGITFATEK
jgi:adenylate cyclase